MNIFINTENARSCITCLRDFKVITTWKVSKLEFWEGKLSSGSILSYKR